MVVVCACLATAGPIAAGCGDDADGSKAGSERASADTPAGAGGSETVKRYPNFVAVAMTYTGYRPAVVHVQQGGTVTWINTGIRRATAENAFDAKPHFDIHTVYPGQWKRLQFDKPGRYDYNSSYDPDTFRGTVIVDPIPEKTKADRG